MDFNRRPSFETRMQPINRPLYGYAVALTRDKDEAADLFQDCIVRAMSARAYPIEDRAFRAWLFKVMRHLWIDRLRSDRRASAMHGQITEVLDGCEPMSLENMVVNRFAVREAFALLSSDHRDVLALIDIAGFSYDEAAGLLRVPQGTVMSRVSRARQALGCLLSDERIAEFPRQGRRHKDA